MATRAPSAAKASAVARPMPWLEAATITARFLSPVSTLARFLQGRASAIILADGSLDLVLLQGLLDAAAQLALHRWAAVGADAHLEEVIHLAGADALDARDFGIGKDGVGESRLGAQLVAHLLQQGEDAAAVFRIGHRDDHLDQAPVAGEVGDDRSEERRVGKECRL